MIAALNVAAVSIALLTALLWLYLDRVAARRQRRWEEHTEQALRNVSPQHPTVWRPEGEGRR